MLKKIRLAIFITAPVLTLIFVVLYLAKPVVPSNIRKKIVFTILLPAGSKNVKYDASSLKYDDANHGISYTAIIDSKKILMSEQAPPDTFSDGPVYSYLLQKSQPYGTLNTAVGQVTLTHPKELKGAQLAITNPPGILIFAHASTSLSTNEWSNLFDSMQKAR